MIHDKVKNNVGNEVNQKNITLFFDELLQAAANDNHLVLNKMAARNFRLQQHHTFIVAILTECSGYVCRWGKSRTIDWLLFS